MMNSRISSAPILLLCLTSLSISRISEADRWTKTMLKISQWRLNKTVDDNRRTNALVEEKYWDMMSIFNKFMTHLFVNATLEEARMMNQTIYKDVTRLRGAHEVFKKFLSPPPDHQQNRFREYDDMDDELEDARVLPSDFFLIATQIDIKPYIASNNVTFNGIIRKYCSEEVFRAETCLTLLYLRAQSSVIKFYSYHKMYSMIQDTPSTLRNYILNSLREIKKNDRVIFSEIFGGKFDKRYGCHLSCPYVGVSTPQSKPQDELIQKIMNGTNDNNKGVLNLKSIGFTSNFIVSHAFLFNYDLIPSCHKKCVETYTPTAVLLFDTKDGEVKFDNETRSKCTKRQNQIILKYNHDFKIDTTFVTGGYVDGKIILCHTGGWRLGECVIATVEKDWKVFFTPIASKLNVDSEYVDGKAIITLDNGKKLWRTGGTIDTSLVRFVRKTNIFVNMTWTTGPYLPVGLGDHCMAEINSTHTLIAGGFTLEENHPMPSQKAWVYDWPNDKWSEVSRMPEPIRFPKCSIKNAENDLLIAGKYRGDTFRVDDMKWTDYGIGELPATSQLFATMVYLKGGPYLYGGQHQISQEKTNKIYKFTGTSWIMDETQSLSRPRQHLFPVPIPMHLLPGCEELA